MKKTIYFSLVVSLAIACSSLHALSAQGINSFSTFGSEINSSASCSWGILVTAAEYAQFLNARARSDDQRFYHEKMGSDPDVGCIMRYGWPKKYSYEVIAGRENFPISYVTKNAAEEYFLWRQRGFSGKGLAGIIGEEYDASNIFITANNGELFIFDANDPLSIHSIVNNLTHPFLFGEIVYSGIITSLIGLIVWKTCGPCYSSSQEEMDPAWKAPSSAEKNSMVSSQETIQLDIGAAEKPVRGHFQAGKQLCREFAETTQQTILESLQKNSSNELTADLGRAEFLVGIQDAKKEPLCSSADSQSKKQGFEKFKKFIGSDKKCLEDAIARIMNQTIFAEALLVIHNLPRAEGKEPYSALELKNLLDDILLETNDDVQIRYELEKQKPFSENAPISFVLTATCRKLNKTLHPQISLRQQYLLLYTFTENPNFSPEKLVSEENLPCTVECKDFQIKYEIKNF